MTFDEIVDAVLAQGGFDVARSMAGGWVNEKHREAVAQAQWMQQEVSLGVTVVGDSDYLVPENVVEIEGLYLLDDMGQPGHWTRASTAELWALKAGRSSVSGSGGVYSPKYGTAGEKLVELYPAPETAGVSIITLASVVPEPMVTGASPVIPVDMHGDLVEGAIGLGLLRMDERGDMAAVYEAKFRAMVQRLARRRIARVGGGASRVRVAGYDF